MRVQDVMTEGVKTIAPTSTAEDAWNLMQLHHVHHLVVTDVSGVIGVLSERDAGGRRGPDHGSRHTVSDLMTTPAITVEPETTVREAANKLRGLSIGCLVVVESGHAVGIVTVSDLLELLGRGIEHGSVNRKRWTLNHRVPHRKVHGRPKAW